ncbi:signal peptidase I [Enterococcus sp. BWB1-3]|uniref:signal peptidase I n=1 Tax=unclassified Enterococcus TaxID=2608891 RepID=UPI00192042C3|nr:MULTISPECIES: signal peptidase I [unclassified Enterococcus]MBL1229468.1 signal peptidase I [Enterococcus sp. BWB1-3]MCB5956333.1 signal peptidase I [Enterococcus sp. CWB-B31]
MKKRTNRKMTVKSQKRQAARSPHYRIEDNKKQTAIKKKRKKITSDIPKERAGRKSSKKRRHLSGKQKGQKKFNQFLVQMSISIVVFSFLIGLISFFTFRLVKVEGYAMTPTLNNRDRLFVSKVEKIKNFDLICYKNSSGESYIRRVIGLPGDRLLYKNNQLYLNEKEELERYLNSSSEGSSQITEDFALVELTGEKWVPEKKYFVLGDNRSYTIDSRHFGFVSEKDIIGVVKLRLFPFHTMVRF